MYHRVGTGKHANSKEMLAEHLSLLQHYPIVLPGEPLSWKRLSICLTFDDAFFDFYHEVFPLLKQFGMRAVVGVPVRYILESTTATAPQRLKIPYSLAMQDGCFETQAPFCTWGELEEMVASGLVHIASHSYMHGNLTFPFINLEQEVVHSKQILEHRLPQVVSSFIYPFGRLNARVHRFVSQHYPYAFRIGSALNFSWDAGCRPLHRICADNTTLHALLSPKRQLQYWVKGISTR